MNFAKFVFLAAGIYGILVTVPLYFLEPQIARLVPPAVTHPEYYYGFIGVTLAFQILFIFLSTDPLRYRLLMLPCIFEKAVYAAEIIVLFSQQRISAMTLGFGMIDLVLGLLFAVAFWATRSRSG